ncbi:MAG: transposase [Bacteroidetes bacterium]|jgi:REP element-mobilizing transposase RayT|nr:transposase [Bacteroidota bacterium]
MGDTRYRIFEQQEPHFLTCTISKWLPVFAYRDVARSILDSLAFLQDADRLTLYGYVLMENHLHLIASAADLSHELMTFKSYTSHTVINLLKDTRRTTFLRMLPRPERPDRGERVYQLWQRGSHPKQILEEDMFVQKLEYIHLNPVKRGYIDKPVHWRYSSARNYAGQRGLIPVTVVL